MDSIDFVLFGTELKNPYQFDFDLDDCGFTGHEDIQIS